MSDKLLGDNLVIDLHLDIASSCAMKARDMLEKNMFGEAKHELAKAVVELEEARKLYRKMNVGK